MKNYYMTQQSLLYPNNLKTFICKILCTTKFIAALFKVAESWKQVKYFFDR